MILELLTVDGKRWEMYVQRAPSPAEVMDRFWKSATVAVRPQGTTSWDSGWTVVTRHVVAFRIDEG